LSLGLPFGISLDLLIIYRVPLTASYVHLQAIFALLNKLSGYSVILNIYVFLKIHDIPKAALQDNFYLTNYISLVEVKFLLRHYHGVPLAVAKRLDWTHWSVGGSAL
jgi:hypothetical protein